MRSRACRSTVPTAARRRSTSYATCSSRPRARPSRSGLDPRSAGAPGRSGHAPPADAVAHLAARAARCRRAAADAGVARLPGRRRSTSSSAASSTISSRRASSKTCSGSRAPVVTTSSCPSPFVASSPPRCASSPRTPRRAAARARRSSAALADDVAPRVLGDVAEPARGPSAPGGIDLDRPRPRAHAGRPDEAPLGNCLRGRRRDRRARRGLRHLRGLGARHRHGRRDDRRSDRADTAFYYNPAALTLDKQHTLSAGPHALGARSSTSSTRGPRRVTRPVLPETHPGISLGWTKPLGGLLDDRVALGISISLPLERLACACRAWIPPRPSCTCTRTCRTSCSSTWASPAT